jgi:hypothetical protein
MRRILLIAFSALVAIGLTATAAFASSPHFKSGSPTCTIGGTASAPTVTCSGSVSGLGNVDLTIDVAATGSGSYTCFNNGGNSAPGQSQVTAAGSSSTPVPANSVKNGTLNFTTNAATLTAPTTISGTAAGCPNGNWQGRLSSITVSSITLTIEQPVGTCVLKATISGSSLTGTVTLTPVSC